MHCKASACSVAGWLMVLLIVTVPLTVADDGVQKIVLVTGAVLEVSGAEVRGDQLVVTRANGAQMAYALEDVDLEASGLWAPEMGQAAQQADQVDDSDSELWGRMSVDGRSAPRSRVTITDADVGHVRGPEASADGERGESPAAEKAQDGSAKLAIRDLRSERRADTKVVVGSVVNDGSVPVATVQIAGEGVDRSGATVAVRTSTISGGLEVGEEARFELVFAGGVEIADVRIRATAGLTEFDFGPAEAPTVRPGETARGREEP